MLQELTLSIARASPFVMTVGLVGVTALTVPGIPFADLRWIEIILWICLLFFATEAGVQVATWHALPSPRPRFLSWGGLANLLAVVPVPIAHLLGVPPATAWLLGALWLFKLQGASSGFSLLRRVLVLEARALASVVVVFLVVLFVAAVAMHLIERDAQPNAFGTLPQSLYWAVTTLSTTGYGDVVPITHLGRLVAGFVMISGLAVFGLWTGILANGFAAETRRRDFTRTWEFVARVPFFKPLPPSAIIEIARMLRAQDMPERTIVVRKGRHGESMYFIASGEVEIVGTNPSVRLGEGAFFGELALLGDGVRTATVATTMPTTLLVLELTDFRIFCAQYPDLARAVEEEGARRLAENRRNRQTAAPPATTGGTDAVEPVAND